MCQQTLKFLISYFRHVLNVVFFLLVDSSVSVFYVPMFRNTLFHLHMRCKLTPPMKIEKTECSKTSAHRIQMPGNHPKEIIQH